MLVIVNLVWLSVLWSKIMALYVLSADYVKWGYCLLFGMEFWCVTRTDYASIV